MYHVRCLYLLDSPTSRIQSQFNNKNQSTFNILLYHANLLWNHKKLHSKKRQQRSRNPKVWTLTGAKMASKFEPGDYYIENGQWVFTAQFLLRRGYCCKNNCRHCPYQSDNRKITCSDNMKHRKGINDTTI